MLKYILLASVIIYRAQAVLPVGSVGGCFPVGGGLPGEGGLPVEGCLPVDESVVGTLPTVDLKVLGDVLESIGNQVCELYDDIARELPSAVSLLGDCCRDPTICDIRRLVDEFFDILYRYVEALHEKCVCEKQKAWSCLGQHLLNTTYSFVNTSDCYLEKRSVYANGLNWLQNRPGLLSLKLFVSTVKPLPNVGDDILLNFFENCPHCTCICCDDVRQKMLNFIGEMRKLADNKTKNLAEGKASYMRPICCVAYKSGISVFEVALDCIKCSEFTKFYVCFVVVISCVGLLVETAQDFFLMFSDLCKGVSIPFLECLNPTHQVNGKVSCPCNG